MCICKKTYQSHCQKGPQKTEEAEYSNESEGGREEGRERARAKSLSNPNDEESENKSISTHTILYNKGQK